MFKTLVALKSKSVLYVDADSLEKTQIEKLLKNLFRSVMVTCNDTDAMTIYKEKSPDVIITSSRADNIDGVKLITQLRQHNYHLPIIVLSALNKQENLLDIINLSIDAYLYRPLNIIEFTNAVFQSTKRDADEKGIMILDKHLIFHRATQELVLDGLVITLGIKERKLLLLFIENRFKIITKEEIASALSTLDLVSDSAIKKIILRLRKKLNTDIITSIRGVGYRLDTKETNISKGNYICQ